MLVPISYTVRFPDPATHYAEVKVTVPTDGRPEVELMMAVWTPGSYFVREYARHVEAVRAVAPTGLRLPVAKSAKNRWLIGTGGAVKVTLTYRVYCYEMSVRTNWVDANFAMLNGAPTFITLADSAPRQHHVRIEKPPGWKSIVTALSPAPDAGVDKYISENFDALVDSPIVVGNPVTYSFIVAETPHALVNFGEGDVWDGSTSAGHVERIVGEQHRTWGFFPYEQFLFINMLVNRRGGLEHKDSTLLLAMREATVDRRQYLRWLRLVSHELFHAWNVKRLRPAPLGPFDYEREALTPDLWIAEGLTSYYDRLVVHRAGISTRWEYFESVSEQIEKLQTTPGRLVQSVSEASYDAWIKYYLPNKNSKNSTISYYTKGAVIGFLLDALVQQHSGGSASLDDVLKVAYDRYATDHGFRPGDFEAVASEMAGADLTEWFDRAVRSTEELDYAQTLEWYGLRFAPEAGDASPIPWLGLKTEVEQRYLLVEEVCSGTPGDEAGFKVGDEVLAINDDRVEPDDWDDQLSLYRPGDQASILVSRDNSLTRLTVRFGARPIESWRLEPIAVPSAEQTKRLDAWLEPSNLP